MYMYTHMDVIYYILYIIMDVACSAGIIQLRDVQGGCRP